MARVKDLNPTDLQGSSRQVYERILDGYGPYRNMLSVFAHRPPALDHIFSYLLQSKADGLISPRHLEIALLTASKAHVCEYCVAHHEPKSLEQGLSQETVDRLLDDDVPGLDPVELLVRATMRFKSRKMPRVSPMPFITGFASIFRRSRLSN